MPYSDNMPEKAPAVTTLLPSPAPSFGQKSEDEERGGTIAQHLEQSGQIANVPINIKIR